MQPGAEFGLPVIVRAETVRVIAEPYGDGHRYRHKPKDTQRFAPHVFGDIDEWPGVEVPEDWAATPKGWEIAPRPNGTVLTRCRRIPLPRPTSGVLIGWVRFNEGGLRPDTSDSVYSYELVDRRQMTLYEVAMPPLRSGRARLVTVHPNDAHILREPVGT